MSLQLPETFESTHPTGGLAGYPAIDEFAKAGTTVLAPATGTIVYQHFIPWDQKKATGGYTEYLDTEHGSYFLTHFGTLGAAGKVQAGEAIGTVGAVPTDAAGKPWWPSHIHEGLNPDTTTGGAGGVSTRTDDKQTFTDVLSNLTGLDPRVVSAWEQSEGHPGDLPGYFNWLNELSTTATARGTPGVGTGPAGVAKFGDIHTGLSASVTEAQALGIFNEKGKSAGEQIQDIGGSKWGTSGATLQQVFIDTYGKDALLDKNKVASPGPEEWLAAGASGSPLGGLPGGGAIKDAIGAVSSVGDALGFLFSVRFLEIVAGFALVAIGVLSLAREAGASLPAMPHA